MSTTTARTPTIEAAPGLSARIGAGFRDASAVTQRNLIALRRTPQALVFATIQPVVFVLLFRFVFGGAINTGTISYVDYLMPGVFVQAVVFGAIGTAIGLAVDLQTGLLERFRSLPMARSAVLVGRTNADMARNAFVVVLMTTVGFVVGFRIHTNLASLLFGMALVVVFGFAMSWIFAVVGLLVGDPETAQAAAFPVMAPLVFASSAFVPVGSMPEWLQPFAEYQPVSIVANAVRSLCLGAQQMRALALEFHTTYHSTAFYVWAAIGWIVLILAISIPFAVRRYRQAV